MPWSDPKTIAPNLRPAAERGGIACGGMRVKATCSPISTVRLYSATACAARSYCRMLTPARAFIVFTTECNSSVTPIARRNFSAASIRHLGGEFHDRGAIGLAEPLARLDQLRDLRQSVPKIAPDAGRSLHHFFRGEIIEEPRRRRHQNRHLLACRNGIVLRLFQRLANRASACERLARALIQARSEARENLKLFELRIKQPQISRHRAIRR